MYINLANIDFGGEGGGKAVLQETTIESLLTETTKVVTPPEGVDGFNKVTVTHAPVETLTEATITSNGETTITPSVGFDATFGVKVSVDVTTGASVIGSPEWVKDMKTKCAEVETPNPDHYSYILPQYASIVNGSGIIPKKNDNNENILDASGNIIYESDLIFPTYDYYSPLCDRKIFTSADQFEAKDYQGLYGQNRTIYKLQSRENIQVRYPFFISNAETYYAPAVFFPVMYDALSDSSTLFGYENAIMLGRFSGTGTYEDPIELAGDQRWEVPTFQKTICNREGVEFGGWIRIQDNALYWENFPADYPPIEISITMNYYGYSSAKSCLPNIISKINKIEFKGRTGSLDYFCKDLTKLTAISEFDSSKITSMASTFRGCTSLVSLPKMDATNLTNSESRTMFGYTYETLPNFTDFGGLTGLKIDLVLSPCPNLTHDSLLNVINEAADVTSSPKTLTLGATNLAKLTDEEKAIATNKGWTLK